MAKRKSIEPSLLDQPVEDKKQTEKTEEKPKKSLIEQAQEDITRLSFYNCEQLKAELQKIAEENDGELTAEQVELMVNANLHSKDKIISMCNFIKLMEMKIEACKFRKKEINESQKEAEDIIEKLKKPLAVFVDKKGKTYTAGEFTLTTRHSKETSIPKDFKDPFFCEQVVVYKPVKKAIKEAIESGEEVSGCEVIEKVNLTIK